MATVDHDLLSFWKALNQNKVRYIMVGGVAAILHGHNRLTEDVDIWIEDTLENRRALRVAFKDCGMGDFFMMERLQIVPGWTYFYLNNGVRLDLMIYLKGLEAFGFDECCQQASIAEIHGVEVPFLSLDHPLQAKRAANRPKDQLDIDYLEELKNLEGGKEEETEQD